MILLSSACSLLPEPPKPVIEIQTVTVEAKITHPNLPRPIDLKEPEWKVVSKANLEEFINILYLLVFLQYFYSKFRRRVYIYFIF